MNGCHSEIKAKSLNVESSTQTKIVTFDVLSDIISYYETKWRKDNVDIWHSAFKVRQLFETRISQEISNISVKSCEKKCIDYTLLTSMFQNRKTFIIIGLVAMQLEAGYTPILITSSVAQAQQLLMRINQEFTELASHLREKYSCSDVVDSQTLDCILEKFDRGVLYSCSTQSNKKAIFEQQKLAITSGQLNNRRRCIVSYKEYTQIKFFLENINTTATTQLNISLFIDEAHKNAGYKYLIDDQTRQHDSNVLYDQYIFELKQQSTKVILITATPSKILWIERNLRICDIFNKKPEDGYRGADAMVFHNDMPHVKNFEGTLDRIFQILIGLSSTELPIHDRGDIIIPHPHIVLCHVSRYISVMKNIFYSFTDKPDNVLYMPKTVTDASWLVCTYLGEGIRIMHKDLPNYESITIENVESVCIGAHGEHFFSNKTGISFCHIFEWCAAHGGVDVFSRIIIFAYDMAYESISFSTHRAPYWHLNRVIASGIHTADDTAQLLARCCGVHRDNQLLHIHSSSSTKNKFIKEVLIVYSHILPCIEHAQLQAKTLLYNDQDILTSDVCDNNSEINQENLRGELNTDLVVNFLQSQVFYHNRIPSRFLSLKVIDYSMNIKTIVNPYEHIERKVFKQPIAIRILSHFDPDQYPVTIDTSLLSDNLSKISEDNNTKQNKYIYLKILTPSDETKFDTSSELYSVYQMTKIALIQLLEKNQLNNKEQLTCIRWFDRTTIINKIHENNSVSKTAFCIRGHMSSFTQKIAQSLDIIDYSRNSLSTSSDEIILNILSTQKLDQNNTQKLLIKKFGHTVEMTLV